VINIQLDLLQKLHRVSADAIQSSGLGWDISAGLRMELGMCMLSGGLSLLMFIAPT
jgi:hypothetical protein